MNYTNEEYLEIYKTMSYARKFSLVFEEYAMKGILPGFHHLSLGQEGLTVGVWTERGENDWIMPAHRCRPMFGWGTDIEAYLAEILGKKTGLCGGLSGDSHIYVPQYRVGPSSGMLGYSQNMGVGVALAYKLKKVDGCVVIGIGDGGFEEGVISEALNMIAIWKLPVVFYIDNNGYGISTPAKYSSAINDLSERAAGFGLPGSSYDATDVFLVKDVMHEAMAKARRGEPSVVEFRTNRWQGHFVGDPATYRDPAEVEEAKMNRDPMKWCRNFMLLHKVATEAEMDAIDQEREAYVRSIVEKTLAAPGKTREDVLRPVFAD